MGDYERRLGQALAQDLNRIKWALLYALAHGGNLPQGFMKPPEPVEHEFPALDDVPRGLTQLPTPPEP